VGRIGPQEVGLREKKKKSRSGLKEREPADWAKRRRGKEIGREKVRVGFRTFKLLILKTININQKPCNGMNATYTKSHFI
jgi:hypothetical protein